MKDSRLPSIFDYFDYRKFLEDYRKARKEFDPGFKHSYICYRLGQVNSKSYYANVVSGTRDITPVFVNRFIEVLELESEEAKHFRALVSYNQTDNPGEKQFFLDQLVKRSIAHSRIISEKEYKFYKDWHHSVIRAILDVHDFRENAFEKLTELINPPVSLSTVKKSIQMLLSMDLIRINENGFYKPTDKSVSTGEYANNEIIRQYQIQCLEMAKMALTVNTNMPDDISTNILSVSSEGILQIREKLRKFREEIRTLVQNDDKKADRVYQLDIQLFSNTKHGDK
jgi:uncharacterized protein (TIGR02147 family)